MVIYKYVLQKSNEFYTTGNRCLTSFELFFLSFCSMLFPLKFVFSYSHLLFLWWKSKSNESKADNHFFCVLIQIYISLCTSQMRSKKNCYMNRIYTLYVCISSFQFVTFVLISKYAKTRQRNLSFIWKIRLENLKVMISSSLHFVHSFHTWLL